MAAGTCDGCGDDFQNVGAHKQHCKAAAPAVAVAVAVKAEKAPPGPRTKRGRRARGFDATPLTPIQQMRRLSGGSAAYYLKTDADSMDIREILVTYPNGNGDRGTLSSNPQRAEKFAKNADLYQARQRRRGLEYVGPTLTIDAARRIAQIMRTNRPDWIAFLEDEIANCKEVIAHAAEPAVKDGQRRRQAQFQKKLDEANQPFSPEKIVAELQAHIAAQKMASIDPKLVEAFALMFQKELPAHVEALTKSYQTWQGPDGQSRERMHPDGVDTDLESGVAHVDLVNA